MNYYPHSYSSPTVNSNDIMNNTVLQQLNAQKSPLPTIPQSVFNNTLPKPLIMKNNKSSLSQSQKCQIKKNLIHLTNNDKLDTIKDKENIFQQTISKCKIPNLTSSNNNFMNQNQLNKTWNILMSLQQENKTQQTSRILLATNQQQQEQLIQGQNRQKQRVNKQQQYQNQQQQRVKWSKQKLCYTQNISKLEQKIRLLEFDNIRLRNQLSIKQLNNKQSLNIINTINNADAYGNNNNKNIVDYNTGVQNVNYIVQRISSKLTSLQSQLTFFTDLSTSLKQQLSKANQTITQLSQLIKINQTQIKTMKEQNLSYIEKIKTIQATNHKLKQEIKDIHQKYLTNINTLELNITSYQQQHISIKQHNQSLQQHNQTLQQQNTHLLQQNTHLLQQNNQLHSSIQSLHQQLSKYQHQYDKLKKHSFLLQQQYCKTIYNNKQSSTYEQQYNQLKQKYQCLYQSYKSLYQQYVNSQQNTSDFINQINSSIDNPNTSYQPLYYLQRENIKQHSQHLLHCNQQSLSDCSDITNPIQATQSCLNLDSTRPTRIILSELIKETLQTQ